MSRRRTISISRAALAAIEAGKHVLVEKPLALNAAEARKLAEAALARRVFLMEAYWTDFLPKFDVLRQLLADGVLGEIHTILADHGEHFTPEHRIMRPDMAGGPLLDLGTYPVAFATKILGSAEQVLAIGQVAPTGVNGQASILLSHAGDAQSVLHTTLFSHTPCEAVIAGSLATLAYSGLVLRARGLHPDQQRQGSPSSIILRSQTATSNCSTKQFISPIVSGMARRSRRSRPFWTRSLRSRPSTRFVASWALYSTRSEPTQACSAGVEDPGRAVSPSCRIAPPPRVGAAMRARR